MPFITLFSMVRLRCHLLLYPKSPALAQSMVGVYRDGVDRKDAFSAVA